MIPTHFGPILALALCAVPTSTEPSSPGVFSFRLELQDQYGAEVRVPVPNESGMAAVTFVALADRRGAEANRSWAAALAARYRDRLEGRAEPVLVVVPIAHLESVPGLFRATVRRMFRRPDRDGSPMIPIALDWRGEAKDQLGLAPGVPNIVILDEEGEVRMQRAGTVEQVGSDVFSLLDRLLL